MEKYKKGILALAVFALAMVLTTFARAWSDDYTLFDLLRGKKPIIARASMPELVKQSQIDIGESSRDFLAQFSASSTELITQVMPAVVSIDAEKTIRRPVQLPWFFGNQIATLKQIVPTLGSGVFIDNKGHIITNYHVIKDVENIVITYSNGEKGTAEIIAVDEQNDTALLLDNDFAKFQTKALAFADSDQLKIGEPVWAIGNPFGQTHSVTQGIISAINRFGNNDTSGRGWLQTDTVINPGNSGGPLINHRGEIVGINVSILNPDASNTWQGVGFAIPANSVKQSITEFFQDPQRSPDDDKKTNNTPMLVKGGYIGVELSELGFQNGVYINRVFLDTPAEKSGLQAGDIVTRINNRAVFRVDDFIARIKNTSIGTVLDLEVVRDGEILQLQTKVAAKDENWQATLQRNRAAPNEFGIILRSLTLQQKLARGLRASDPALIIMAVNDDSPFAGKIQAYDLIHGINNSPTHSEDDFLQIINEKLNSKQPIKIHTSRDGSPRSIIFK